MRQIERESNEIVFFVLYFERKSLLAFEKHSQFSLQNNFLFLTFAEYAHIHVCYYKDFLVLCFVLISLSSLFFSLFISFCLFCVYSHIYFEMFCFVLLLFWYCKAFSKKAFRPFNHLDILFLFCFCNLFFRQAYLLITHIDIQL